MTKIAIYMSGLGVSLALALLAGPLSLLVVFLLCLATIVFSTGYASTDHHEFDDSGLFAGGN